MKKLANPYQRTAFAIINPHGDVWDGDLYDSAEEAAGFLDRFWGARDKWLAIGFTLAPATAITIVIGPERIKLP